VQSKSCAEHGRRKVEVCLEQDNHYHSKYVIGIMARIAVLLGPALEP
jgi:hypothetical protein